MQNVFSVIIYILGIALDFYLIVAIYETHKLSKGCYDEIIKLHNRIIELEYKLKNINNS